MSQPVYQDQLRTANLRLGALIDHLHSAVIVEDEERRISFVNREFCEVFGIPAAPDELIGADCSNAARDAKALMRDPEAFLARIEEITSRRETVLNDEVTFADGRVYERDYLPIHLDGDYRGHMWQYRDVTQHQVSKRKLQDARDAAQEANQAKSMFLANMSHEIRTPMTAVLGLTYLLLETKLTDEQHEYLRRMRESAAHLLDVVNDVLDLSRIESGQFELTIQEFNIVRQLAVVADLFTYQAAEKGIAFELSIADNMHEDVMGDSARLKQILMNLLSNAFKFTDSGRINLKARMLESEKPGVRRYEFAVSDTGKGIPPNKLSAVFDDYVQLPDGLSRGRDGTGLGLGISRHFVESMGGDIRVESCLGRGTTFTFTAEFETPSSSEKPGEPEALRGDPELPPLRILLVEDNEDNQLIGRRFLERHGHAVTVAVNGRDALDTLETNRVRGDAPFDLILMDIEMPVMDGREAVRRLRALDAPEARLPVIALTAHALRDDRARFRNAGLDGYLSKPWTYGDLAGEAAGVLGYEHKHRRGAN